MKRSKHAPPDPVKVALVSLEWSAWVRSREMLDAIRGWVLAVCSTQNRGIVSVVDSGYDVSTHGSVSDVPLQAEDFVTLGDLLDAPNGGTDATYVSGSGLRATTFEDDLMHKLFEVKAEWISAEW